MLIKRESEIEVPYLILSRRHYKPQHHPHPRRPLRFRSQCKSPQTPEYPDLRLLALALVLISSGQLCAGIVM